MPGTIIICHTYPTGDYNIGLTCSEVTIVNPLQIWDILKSKIGLNVNANRPHNHQKILIVG